MSVALNTCTCIVLKAEYESWLDEGRVGELPSEYESCRHTPPSTHPHPVCLQHMHINVRKRVCSARGKRVCSAGGKRGWQERLARGAASQERLSTQSSCQHSLLSLPVNTRAPVNTRGKSACQHKSSSQHSLLARRQQSLRGNKPASLRANTHTASFKSANTYHFFHVCLYLVVSHALVA